MSGRSPELVVPVVGITGILPSEGETHCDSVNIFSRKALFTHNQDM